MASSDGLDQVPLAGERPPLEQYRGYLCALAQMGMPQEFAGKIDASDIAQQTLLQAVAAHQQLRGLSDAECMAWLRQILAHTLSHNLRDLTRNKRDVRKEVPLEQRLEHSSCCLLQLTISHDTSPLSQLVRQEQRQELLARLSDMPPRQRDAILLKYWHGLTLAEIADRWKQSPAAIAGIIHRGLKNLRTELGANPLDSRQGIIDTHGK